MNKNQLIYTGTGLAGIVISGLAIWYVGRKSYKQGRRDGYDIAVEIRKISDDLENMGNQKTES